MTTQSSHNTHTHPASHRPTLDEVANRVLDGERLGSRELGGLLIPSGNRDVTTLQGLVRDRLDQQQGLPGVGHPVPLILSTHCELPRSSPETFTETTPQRSNRDLMESWLEWGEKHHPDNVNRVVLYSGFDSHLSVGGLEGATPLKTACKVLNYLRNRSPELVREGFSPAFIEFLAIVSDRSLEYTLDALWDNGLQVLHDESGQWMPAPSILKKSAKPSSNPKQDKHLSHEAWQAILRQAAHRQLPVVLSVPVIPPRLATPQQTRALITHLVQWGNTWDVLNTRGENPLTIQRIQLWHHANATYTTALPASLSYWQWLQTIHTVGAIVALYFQSQSPEALPPVCAAAPPWPWNEEDSAGTSAPLPSPSSTHWPSHTTLRHLQEELSAAQAFGINQSATVTDNVVAQWVWHQSPQVWDEAVQPWLSDLMATALIAAPSSPHIPHTSPHPKSLTP